MTNWSSVSGAYLWYNLLNRISPLEYVKADKEEFITLQDLATEIRRRLDLLEEKGIINPTA